MDTWNRYVQAVEEMRNTRRDPKRAKRRAMQSASAVVEVIEVRTRGIPLRALIEPR